MKKTRRKWIEFDFNVQEDKFIVSEENEIISNTTSTLSSTEKHGSQTVPEKRKRTFNFERKLKPKMITDLAIHPKKVKEVESWLQENVLKGHSNQETATFLLITGPTGSGKTITLQVLCENMSIGLTEWVNPVDQDFDTFGGQNQITRFTEFLIDSKWNSLFSVYDKKVVVVEEFPNSLIRNPSNFDGVLEDCYYKGNYPIVFICSDSNNSGHNLPDILFPQDVRNKYKIAHISFNACATTLMKNALRRAHNLIQENLDLFKTPSPNTVEAIIVSSMGDLRCAINQYYFASLLGSSDIPTVNKGTKRQGSKRKRNESTSSLKFMSKDENLGLFHALGRVLNPKRVETGNSWKLNCDLEKLVNEFNGQPERFTSFLFENYLKYFGNLNDACKASETLSSSQLFFYKWIDHQDTLIYGLWAAVLGLMIYNEHKISKWNQIRGPKKIKKRINADKSTRYLSVTDLYYYNKITKNELSQFKEN